MTPNEIANLFNLDSLKSNEILYKYDSPNEFSQQLEDELIYVVEDRLKEDGYEIDEDNLIDAVAILIERLTTGQQN